MSSTAPAPEFQPGAAVLPSATPAAALQPQPSVLPATPTAAATPRTIELPTATAPIATNVIVGPSPAPAEGVSVLPVAYSYPIGLPGRAPGDGFFIRDAYGVENTWYNPGWWHTGEDWYAQEGSSVGARVYAVTDGEVVYAGANYPGRVVIIKHADGLFSMYGHLNLKLAVKVGQQVARGELLGTVGPDWSQAPGHLHFEIRTFLTAREVNGAAPRYDYRCGLNCLPGPGYWPIKAPEHPSEMGWRNPTHVIAAGAASTLGEVAVVTSPISPSVTLWSEPPSAGEVGHVLKEMTLQPGERFALLGVQAGPEDTRETSAAAYQLWYRIALPGGQRGWVQAAVPSAHETGSDGRPDSVFFTMVPAIPSAP